MGMMKKVARQQKKGIDPVMAEIDRKWLAYGRHETQEKSRIGHDLTVLRMDMLKQQADANLRAAGMRPTKPNPRLERAAASIRHLALKRQVSAISTFLTIEKARMASPAPIRKAPTRQEHAAVVARMRGIKARVSAITRKGYPGAIQVPEVKHFLVKDARLGQDNSLIGHAAAMGNIDQGADVIFPGFFTDVLSEFMSDGAVQLSHDWSALPIAMPTKAEERGNRLYTEAVFHNTQAGQEARTVARERLDAGKSMGLSVGFSSKPEGEKWFKNGKELIEYARKIGCNMSLFDVAGITAYNLSCRGLLPGGCSRLYEYSVTMFPMNTSAGATSAKSGLPARQLSSRERMALRARLTALKTQVDATVRKAKAT